MTSERTTPSPAVPLCVEAKECPLCGALAVARPIQSSKKGWQVGCSACNLWLTVAVLRQSLAWGKEKAIELWNRRASRKCTSCGEIMSSDCAHCEHLWQS